MQILWWHLRLSWSSLWSFARQCREHNGNMLHGKASKPPKHASLHVCASLITQKQKQKMWMEAKPSCIFLKMENFVWIISLYFSIRWYLSWYCFSWTPALQTLHDAFNAIKTTLQIIMLSAIIPLSLKRGVASCHHRKCDCGNRDKR